MSRTGEGEDGLCKTLIFAGVLTSFWDNESTSGEEFLRHDYMKLYKCAGRNCKTKRDKMKYFHKIDWSSKCPNYDLVTPLTYYHLGAAIPARKQEKFTPKANQIFWVFSLFLKFLQPSSDNKLSTQHNNGKRSR